MTSDPRQVLQRARVRPGTPHYARQVELLEPLERSARDLFPSSARCEIPEQPDGGDAPRRDGRLGRDGFKLLQPCILVALGEGEDRLEDSRRHRSTSEARAHVTRRTRLAEPRETYSVPRGGTRVDATDGGHLRQHGTGVIATEQVIDANTSALDVMLCARHFPE
jgi:hypothetical protein